MKTRLFRLFCALLLICLLPGCGSAGDDAVTVVKVWQDNGEEIDADASIEDDSSSSAHKVGMVTDVGGVDDESFNQGAWEGLIALSESAKVETVYEESASEADFSPNLQKLIDDGCDLCWGVGYAMADAVYEKAVENPDINFAVIDSSYDDTPSNVTGVVFRAEEPSFVVGYIAAASTKTGKLGFVGGMRSEVMEQFEYGFRAGADYAAALYGKEISMGIDYADSFSDPEKGKELAEEMYKNGCDIIYHAAGATGIGVIEAAKKSGNYVIGVDRDQSYLAPDNVLTSAMKLVNSAVQRVSLSYLNSEDIGGQTLSFGLSEGAVGIPSEHPNVRDEIYDAALVIEDMIKSGEIDPPANEKEYGGFTWER